MSTIETRQHRLFIATTNPDKLKELRHLLRHPLLDLYDPTMLNGDWSDVEETGTTYEENARIKAEHAWARLHTSAAWNDVTVLAEDSGLEVPFLEYSRDPRLPEIYPLPGVMSARFAGPNATTEENRKLLLECMDWIVQRQAGYRCCLHVIGPLVADYPDSRATFDDECDGRILEKAEVKGDGFGYDPLFYSHDLERPFSAVPMEVKSLVSHRGRAVRQFLDGVDANIARLL